MSPAVTIIFCLSSSIGRLSDHRISLKPGLSDAMTHPASLIQPAVRTNFSGPVDFA